jgi:hypothetical protein
MLADVKPAVIGTPPSERGMWPDPVARAHDFARRYAESMDYHAAQRMGELGIPEKKIGRPEPDAGGHWRAFFPHEGDGGGVVGDKIKVDAGLFDVSLMRRRYGPELGENCANDRLRDRLDQVVAHEDAEAAGIRHEEAIERAAEMPLPIRATARQRLRRIAEVERRGKGR